MPIAKVRLPDGRVARFKVPEGTTQDQVIAFAQTQFQPQKQIQQQPQEQSLDPTEGMGTGEKLAAGAGKAMVDLGRGVQQIGAETGSRLSTQDFANPFVPVIGSPPKARDPIVSQEQLQTVQANIDESRKRDAALMDTAAGKVGNIAGNVAMTLPTMAIPGINTYTGAGLTGATLGALQPTAEGESRGANTAIGFLGGQAGKFAGDKISGGLTSALNKYRSSLASRQSQNALRDTALREGQQAGFTVPPSQANNSTFNRVLEGFAGKAGVAQGASLKNQEVTNKLAKQALGLPDDAPLTEQSLQSLRSQAGKAYQAIKDLNVRMSPDKQFANEIASLGDDFAAAAQEFPELVRNQAIEDLRTSLSKQDFSPKAAIELVKKLRFDASKNFKSFDDPAKAALGRAQRNAADALDSLIERSIPDPQMAQTYRDARQLIAKSYDVEAALNESTGNISAKTLAKALEKGKPLTGELEQIATFSRAFPKATQTTEPLSGVLGGSPLDWVLGGATAAGTGNPALLATVLARPGARKALLSGPYQKLLAQPESYQAGTMQQLVEALMRKDLPRQAITGAGAAIPLQVN